MPLKLEPVSSTAEIVVILYADDAVRQRMDLSGCFLAVFVLAFYLRPPLPLTRNDNAHLFLEVPCRNRRLAPIVNFAIGPSGNDRVERNDAKATFGGFGSPEDGPLVSSDGPTEPRTIHEKAVILEPYRQGNPLCRSIQ